MFRTPLTLAILAGALAAPAHAETTQCTAITSLPATIATSGIYCLNQDLATALASGSAITVNANNVVIDCNLHRIGGLAAGDATNTDGITASNRQNLTIRNCTIRGFRNGLYLNGGSGHLVEDNLLDQHTLTGAVINGTAHVFRRNRVIGIGGRAGVAARGLEITGQGISVLDNLISGVMPVGPGDQIAMGIDVDGPSNNISRNHITEVFPFGATGANGIGGTGDSVFRENTISNSSTTTGTGLAGGSTSSICADNIVFNYTIEAPSSCTYVGYNPVVE